MATFGDSTNFPAFYSRTSGCHAPYNVVSAIEAAEIIDSSLNLNLKSGMLFAVPVPEKNALEEQFLHEAIEQALEDAQRQGVAGKNITPFLLNAVAKITKGRSLQTSILFYGCLRKLSFTKQNKIKAFASASDPPF